MQCLSYHISKNKSKQKMSMISVKYSLKLYSRFQVKVQRVITTHIEMQGDRTENNDPSKYDRRL